LLSLEFDANVPYFETKRSELRGPVWLPAFRHWRSSHC
jgi:hypothetical protein